MGGGSVWWAGSLQVMRPWRVPPDEEESLREEGTMNQEGWVRTTSGSRRSGADDVDAGVAGVGFWAVVVVVVVVVGFLFGSDLDVAGVP